MKKYLLLIFVLFLFIPKVNADTNYNTFYDFTLNEFNSLSTTYIDSNNTYINFLENLVDITSYGNYDTIINFFTHRGTPDEIIVYLIEKDNNRHGHFDFYSNAYNFIFNLIQLRDIKVTNFRFSYVNGDIYSSQNYTSLMNCLINNNCSWVNSSKVNFSYVNKNVTINNDSSYSINFNNDFYNGYSNGILYYSSLPLIYNQTTFESDYYYKSLKFNNRVYSNGDTLPTYRDLYSNVYRRVDSETGISTINIGNITDLYNFRFNLKFNFDNSNMINNMFPVFYVYGRKNMGTYYTYDRLDSCSAINNHKLDKTITGNSATFNYFSQGIYCSGVNYSDYDYFYIKLSTISNSSGSYFIENISYNSNQGKVIFGKTYDIYDTFNYLPYDFSIFLTSNEPSTTASYISNNKYTCSNLVDLSSLIIDSSICLSPATFGKTINRGFMVFNMRNYDTSSTNLSLLFNENTIVSFGSLGSQDDSSFSYYDSNGDIVSNVISNKMTIKDISDYDISDYINIYNEYLSSIRDKINNFALQVQNFYDSMPGFFQTFMYVTMLTFGIYIIFLAVRKW